MAPTWQDQVVTIELTIKDLMWVITAVEGMKDDAQEQGTVDVLEAISENLGSIARAHVPAEFKTDAGQNPVMRA